jgi:hypothetical protein
MTALTRLLSRVNESGGGGGISSLLRDGRSAVISTRNPTTGNMINVAINPHTASLLGPQLGATSAMNTLELLSQPGNLMLGPESDRLWDEALTQLMEALGQQGGAPRMRNGGHGTVLPGHAAAARAGSAGGVGDGSGGLDPRECVLGHGAADGLWDARGGRGVCCLMLLTAVLCLLLFNALQARWRVT